MKISEFNAGTIEQKVSYINSFIPSLPSVSSAIIFENYTIFVVSSLKGEINRATAHINPPQAKADAIKLLTVAGSLFVCKDLMDYPKMKQTVL